MSHPPHTPDQQPAGGYPPPTAPVPADPTGHPPVPAADGAYPTPPGFPGDTSPVPQKKKSSALKIVLIILAVLAVLCAGTITAIWVAVKDSGLGKVVEKAQEASKITLVTPDTLGGRAKATDPTLAGVNEQLTSGLKESVPHAKSTVGAIYGEVAKQDMLFVVGATAVVVEPEKELDTVLTGLNAAGTVAVDAGPLGGSAKCGTAKDDDSELAVCAWADAGSIGVLGLFFKPVDELKKDFVALRGEVEKKS
jgi:hypothetical protein